MRTGSSDQVSNLLIGSGQSSSSLQAEHRPRGKPSSSESNLRFYRSSSSIASFSSLPIRRRHTRVASSRIRPALRRTRAYSCCAKVTMSALPSKTAKRSGVVFFKDTSLPTPASQLFAPSKQIVKRYVHSIFRDSVNRFRQLNCAVSQPH